MEGGGSTAAGASPSVVRDVGRRASRCGYCSSSSPSSISHGKCSHGLWGENLTADDYQDLLDRGWRRSGCYLYKPEMETSCCPSYTIRLRTSDFVSSKEHRRVIKKMERFLDGEIDWNGNSLSQNTNLPKNSAGKLTPDSLGKSSMNRSSGSCTATSQESEFISHLVDGIDSAVKVYFEGNTAYQDLQIPKAVVKGINLQTKKKLKDLSTDLLCTSSISFQIAASLRNAVPKGESSTESVQHDISANSIAESLARFIDNNGIIPQVEIKACNGHLNFYSRNRHESTNDVSSEFCPGVKEDEVKRPKENKALKDNRQALPQRRLEMLMERSKFDREEYKLFRKYQSKVHQDNDVSESSYRRFLVDTPIPYVAPREGDDKIPPSGFGSFHQKYIVDGKLIAVGVVDILPKCLSSKYLFWDPDLSFLSLGKYTALREISWVQSCREHCPSLQYYYLGYYIHSCIKMRYKAAYRPSQLLCPLRYEWVPFDKAKPLLDKSKYAVISDSLRVQHEPSKTGDCVESSSPGTTSDFPTGDSEHDNYDYMDIVDDSAEVDSPTSETDFAGDGKTIYDIGNIIVEANGFRVKYKDFEEVFHPLQASFARKLEGKMHRFAELVGEELSGRMVYSLQ